MLCGAVIAYLAPTKRGDNQVTRGVDPLALSLDLSIVFFVSLNILVKLSALKRDEPLDDRAATCMLDDRGGVLGDHLKESLPRRDLAVEVDKAVLTTLFTLRGRALGFDAEALEEPWVTAERSAVSTEDIDKAAAPKSRVLCRERQGAPVKLCGERAEATLASRRS